MIFSHEDVAYYFEKFDVLIIDEAHKIVTKEINDEENEFTKICSEAKVLLLLTATLLLGMSIGFSTFYDYSIPKSINQTLSLIFKKKSWTVLKLDGFC